MVSHGGEHQCRDIAQNEKKRLRQSNLVMTITIQTKSFG